MPATNRPIRHLGFYQLLGGITFRGCVLSVIYLFVENGLLLLLFA